MSFFVAGWYLVYTKPRQEKKVATQLSKSDIKTFLPVFKNKGNRVDGKKLGFTPLFPSYVFVQLKSMTDYYTCADTDGVITYVKFGKKITRVKDEVIQNISMLVDNCPDIAVLSGNVHSGQKVRIEDGPLSGLSCEIAEHEGQQKVLVHVSVLNLYIVVNVSLNKYLIEMC